MNDKIAKRQERAFMASRHPGMKYNKATDSWVGAGGGMDRAEVLSEALAELELTQAGVAKMPAWASE